MPPEPGASTSTGIFRFAASLGSLLFCVISFVPREGPAKYRYSFLFLVPIVWIVYASRRSLRLRPLHFVLFTFALVLHDLGAFGWYSRSVAGLQFDWCVHFMFGLVGGLIIARMLERRLGLRGAGAALLVTLVVIGIGAVHEIIEAASTVVLGEEYGMLHLGPGSQFDTQQDLLANLLGAGTALVARALCGREEMSVRNEG